LYPIASRICVIYEHGITHEETKKKTRRKIQKKKVLKKGCIEIIGVVALNEKNVLVSLSDDPMVTMLVPSKKEHPFSIDVHFA
jgi:hypothetical protein